MIDASQKDLIDRYLAAYNAFDIEAMLAQLGARSASRTSGGQLTAETTGIEAFRQLAEQSRGMFSEREQRVTGLAQAATRWWRTSPGAAGWRWMCRTVRRRVPCSK
jgi:hypothetical protein